MSTRSSLLAAAASAGVLFLGWQAGAGAIATGRAGSSATAAPTAGGSPSGSTTSGPSSSGPSSSGSSSSGSSSSGTTSGSSSSPTTSATTAAATYKDGTYTGTTVSHHYGTVAVKVTVSGGRITDVSANASAHDGHSQQINSRSIPTLRSRVLSAQSSDVSTVSGATYTSGAYLDSLQSALDRARA